MYCFGAKAFRFFLVFFALVGLSIPTVTHASGPSGTSVFCPNLTATVANGGSVQINVSSCDGPFDAGVSGPRAPLPQHGTVTVSPATGGTQFVTYTHNGNSATSDTIWFADENGGTIRIDITISAATSPIAVSPASLSPLVAGAPFSQTLSASGGTGPYSFALASGSLPPGLSLSAAGVLSGTPTQRGNFSFSVLVTDSTGPTPLTTTKGYSGTVGNPSLSLVQASGTAIQGAAFSQTLATSGGVAPYRYQVSSGAPPAGITLSPEGVLSGVTSAAPGNYPFTVRVDDSSTGTAVYFELETFTLTVSQPPSVSITVSPASVSEDGTTNLTYTVARSFATPGAVTVNLAYSGTATSGTDYTGASGTIVIPANATSATLTIDPVADAVAEPNETVTVSIAAGSGYSIGSPSSATGTITNDDGTSTYPGCATRNVSVANGGTVRVDLSTCHIFGLGVVSQAPAHGTATAGPGPINFYDYTHNGNSATSDRFVVLDDNSQTIVVNVSIAAPTSAIVVSPANLGPMTAGTAFSQTLTSTGGTGPYTYAPVSGALPVGLSLSGTGVISGTPTQRGSYSFEVRSQDALGAFTVKGYSGTIAPASLTLTSSTGAAIQGVAFSQTLTTTNGVAPFAYQLETGSWPAGISLAGNGVLSGTTSAAPGSYPVTIRVTDSSTGIGTNFQLQPFTLTVSAPPSVSITVSPASVSEDGANNLTYTVTRSANLSSPTVVNITTAGTATAGTDYTGSVPTITIPANATSATIVIDPTVDSALEPDETVILTIAAGSGYTVGSPASATGTIINDDVPVTISPGALPDATAGQPYSQTLSASGGTAPYSFAVTSGALPPGLSLSGGGLLSGTPGAGGDFAFAVTATDGSGAPGPFSGTQSYTLRIADAVIDLPSASLPAGTVGSSYSASVPAASGGTAPYSYTVTAGQLPDGLTLTASTGAISGIPTTPGSYLFDVRATDASTGTGPFSATRSYAIEITDRAPVVNPVSMTVPYNSGPVNVPVSFSGGTPTSYGEVTSPAHGTVITLGTEITYQPNPGYAGPDSFTYNANNNGGTSAPATVTVTVSNPVISVSASGSLAATVGAPYSQTFSWTGGSAPFSGFQVTGLPAGLAITGTTANSVTISGTPTQAGSFSVNASATDSSTGNGPFMVGQTFTLTVAPPVLILAPGAGGLTAAYGTPFSQSFTASGGIGGYNYSMTGSLPAGIGFDPASGLLSGSTFAVGDFAFAITATDRGTSGAGAPFSVTQNYTLRVTPPTLQLTPGSLPGAAVGTSYSATLSANGGAAPYSYAVTSGDLPAGLNLSVGGVISGTPTAGGVFTFTVTASDSGPAPGPFTVSRSYTLDVAEPVVALPATSLSNGQRGSAYSATLNPATGGTAPYTYAVSGGALPAGLGLSSNGALTGTPTVFGNFSFTVTATDSSTGTGPYTGTQTYTLAIIADPPVAGPVSVTLPYGAPSTPIALNLSGGPASSVTVQSGPANGSASVSGTVLSYQPQADFSGTDSISYTATNEGGTSAPATITITVSAPSLSVTASGPLDAVVGAPYTQTFRFAGGSAPFRSHEVTGLPAGLALTGTTANSVTISGTPRSQGTFSLSVSATDSSTGNGPFTASQAFALTVAAPNLSLTPATGTFSAPYAAPFSQTFAATGGIGAYSYAVSGTLPAGLVLDGTTGTFSGSPTQTGSFAFTVTATDTGASGPGAPFSIAGSYTLNVTPPTITVSPTALPNASSGTAYSVNLNGSGAVAPYTFTISGGALPAGLALTSGGQITGTPTASGNFPFEVTIRDSNGQTSPASLLLTVDVPTLTVTPTTLPNAAQGLPYSQTLTVSGGVAPYRFSIGSGALPAGLALDPVRGIISGTPTGSGTANFAVTVTDSTSGTAASATVAYSLQITARPDPARDPEVRGLTQAQVLASRRFADTQVNNFMRRLESMHGNARSTGGFQNGVRLTSNNYCEDTVTRWTSDICRTTEAQPGLRTRDGATGDETSLGAETGSVAAERPWTVWTGGTVRFGERDPASGVAGQDFESEGLSLGADYRFSSSFAAGIGVGFGRDTANVGENQSRSSGEATTIAVYGSHQLGSGIFLDWLGGYQWLDFDLRRYVTSTGALVNSNRSGNQWFVTGSAGADIATGNWQITPYARVDVRRGTLNGYTENSGSLFDLRFLDQDVDFTSLGLGTVVNYQHRFRRATLLPRLRIEYLYDIERSAEARVAYADLISGPFSVIPLTGISREQLTLGFGTEVLFGEAFSLELEYLGRIASGSGTDQSLQAGVSVKF